MTIQLVSRIGGGVVFLVVSAMCFGQDLPQISASPASIELGQSVTLKWQSRATSAYLSSIGKVKPSGEKSIKPAVTTRYVLIAQTDAGFQYATATVSVIGQRGDSAPDPDDFPSGAFAEDNSVPYIDFVDCVFKTLQNKLSFNVRCQAPGPPPATSYFFYTDKRPRASLSAGSNRGVRQRRIAYAVRTETPRASSAPPPPIKFEVRVLIDYQLLGESQWRPENDPVILQKAKEELVTELATACGG